MATVTLCFYAQFTASKAGLSGLTVVWDLERITRADGTRSALQTGAATNITVGRRGLYGYYQTGCDLDLYDYVATAITSDTTVDQKEVPSLWTYWIADIQDAAVGSVTGNVGGNVVGSVASVTSGVTVTTNNDKTGYALTSAYDPAKTAAQAGDAMTLTSGERTTLAGVVWAALTSAITTAGSIGKLIKDFIGSSTYTAPDNTSITAIKAKTDNLPSSPAATSDIPSASTIASTVWAYGTRTLSSYGTLVSDIATAVWGAASRTLTAFGFGVTVTTNSDKSGYSLTTTPPTAAEVADAVWDEATSGHATSGTTGKALSDAGAAGDPWAAPVRTLTTPANGTGGSADAGTFTVYRGTSWSIAVTGLGSLADRVKLCVTAKNVYGETDADAVLQWEESAGLLRLNGAAATANQGALTVTDANAGNITLTLKSAASKDVAPKSYLLDIKKITASGADLVGTATLEVRPVVTQAVS